GQYRYHNRNNEWFTRTNVGCDGAAEVAGEQDSSENGRAWKCIDQGADDAGYVDPDHHSGSTGIAILGELWSKVSNLDDSHDAADQQKQHHKSTYNPARPHQLA